MRSSVNAPAHPAPSTVQQPVSPLGALTDASGVETRRASVDHFIPNCYAVGFLAGARSKGVDLPSMMLRHGIMPSLQESPASRISLDRFANLLARLGRHMRDESVGLASRPVKPGTFGLVAAQMVRCATLHEALQLGFKMYRLAIDDFSAHLRIEADGSAHVVL
ncbi:MAG: AraC family transcriptional regulator ligand-binding domain-containing protein, partial [Janthinobacterium lividum]